jgi:sec-independent protein translocase protein TatA
MGSTLLTPTHLIFLLLIALLLFGAKRLPEIGRSLGTGMREFKDSVTTSDNKVETHSELPPPVATAPVASAPVAAAPVPAGPTAPAVAPEAAPAEPQASPDTAAEREAEPVS